MDVNKPKNEDVIIANKTRIPVESQGDVYLNVSINESVATVKVKDVLYVPGLVTKVLSVSEMTKEETKWSLGCNGCKIFNSHNQVAAAVVGNIICTN